MVGASSCELGVPLDELDTSPEKAPVAHSRSRSDRSRETAGAAHKGATWSALAPESCEGILECFRPALGPDDELLAKLLRQYERDGDAARSALVGLGRYRLVRARGRYTI